MRKSTAFSTPVLITWIVIASLVSFSLVKHIISLHEASKRVSVLEEEKRGMEENKEILASRLNQAQSQFAREEIIRNELGMQKPGEQIVQVAPEVKGAETVADGAEHTIEEAEKAVEAASQNVVQRFFTWLQSLFSQR